MTDETVEIVRKANELLYKAVKANASDVHVECFERRAVVRFRIDGLLHVEDELEKEAYLHLVRRFKMMGALDITEVRRPQDGRIKLTVMNEQVDVRINTTPCVHGESLVMRILQPQHLRLEVDALTLSDKQREMLKTWYNRPNGLILVTGPTGSGKTTTLYAVMNELNSPERKVMSVEDPVEYLFDGINQMQHNPRSGLTFASALRAMMRQDPDVIMLNEIRDAECAQLMAQIALTGHLALTQLHTDNATSAVTRMLDVGVEPFLLNNVLIGALNQRLVRKLCKHCKEAYQIDKSTMSDLQLDTRSFYRAKGCKKCRNTGYSGRMALYELFQPSKSTKTLVLKESDEESLRRQAIVDGMVTLWQDGIEKAKAGETSLEELSRVVQPEL